MTFKAVINLVTAAALFGAAVMLTGCTTVTRFTGLPTDATGSYVSGVIPVRQDGRHGCGGACVAAVAGLWGVPLDRFNRTHAQTPPDTTGAELVALAENLGLRAFAYQGSPDDLQENLRHGRPLIVMLPLPIAPRGGLLTSAILNVWNHAGPRPPHWVVALGAIGNRVILHDPASGPLTVPESAFRNWWAQMDHRCVLIARAE